MVRTYFKQESQKLVIDHDDTCFNWHVLSVGEPDSRGRQLVTVNIVTNFEGVDLVGEAVSLVKYARQHLDSGDPLNEVVDLMKAAMSGIELAAFLLEVRLLS